VTTIVWREPRVQQLYDRWMADHWGELDMELLLTAVYRAGQRDGIFATTVFSGIMADVSRVEGRIVGLRSLLESLRPDEP
jgi:hypothetical protein